MTRRAATTQGFLALAGLVAAYLTWQREPSLESGQSYVLDINKSELSLVRFEELDRQPKPKDDAGAEKKAENEAPADKKNEAPAETDVTAREWVELFSAKGNEGPVVWVRLSGKEGANVALPSGHPVVQTAVPERVLRGNDSAKALWEGFAPWRASRSLGVLDAEKLKDLGLAEPKKRLKITFKGVTRTYSLAPAPPGGTDPYVRDEEDGRVYIVSRNVLSDFQSAKTNLVERRLHNFLLQDIDQLVVTANGKKKEYRFRRFEGRPGGELFPSDAPDKADQSVGNWHDRVFALFPAEVLGRDEKPVGGPPKESLRLEYFYRGKPLGHLVLARAGNSTDGGESASGTPRSEALARSEFTAGWITLSADAQNLLSEGETMFGGGS